MNIYGVATGTDTYSIDVNAAPGDKLQRGDIVTASFLNANTGAATLEVNGGGRFPILLSGVAISAGVLSTGVDFQMTFTGSTFSLDSASSSSLSADGIAQLLGFADAADFTAALAAKIAAATLTTNGDLLTRTAGVPARLGMGSALQVLRVNAGATALEFATAASGGNAAIVAVLTKSANQSALSSGSDNVITWDTEATDVGGYHDNGSNTERVTIPSGGDGDYLIIACCDLDFTGDNTVEFGFRKNGTATKRASYRYKTTGSYYNRPLLAAWGFTGLVATDYLDFVVKPPAANATPLGGSAVSSYLILVRIS